MNTNKILIISVGILFTLNVVLITMVFIGGPGHSGKRHFRQGPPGQGVHDKKGSKLEGFLRHELEFNAEELEKVTQEKEKHMEFVKVKHRQLHGLNERYFTCISDDACLNESEILKQIELCHDEILEDRYRHFKVILALEDDVDKKEKLKRLLIRLSSNGPKHHRPKP